MEFLLLFFLETNFNLLPIRIEYTEFGKFNTGICFVVTFIHLFVYFSLHTFSPYTIFLNKTHLRTFTHTISIDIGHLFCIFNSLFAYYDLNATASEQTTVFACIWFTLLLFRTQNYRWSEMVMMMVVLLMLLTVMMMMMISYDVFVLFAMHTQCKLNINSGNANVAYEREIYVYTIVHAHKHTHENYFSFESMKKLHEKLQPKERNEMLFVHEKK